MCGLSLPLTRISNSECRKGDPPGSVPPPERYPRSICRRCANVGDIPRLARHFLQVAARELGVEAKLLHPETEAALTRLAWPGNVRQLENTCRWLTVMAAGQEVLIQDLPGELFESTVAESTSQMQPDSWATLLAQWVYIVLRSGHQNLLSEAQPELERTLLTTALRHTQGHKQEAARLLGWGRNTLNVQS